jgi:uridine kinase
VPIPEAVIPRSMHMKDLSAIHPSAPRTSVQATLPDGRVFEAPVGTSLRDILEASATPDDYPAVAAIVDGRLTELTEPLTSDAEVARVTVRDGDGVRIYRRSLVFLLVTAAAEVCPDAAVVIDHAATTVGAYFCSVVGRPPLSQAELDDIAARMREIAAADAPIVKAAYTNDEAMAVFNARGERDKARLLAHRTKRGINLYELRGRLDYFQGYMVPSTGLLKHFALHAYPPGFMLQFPHQSRPTELGPITPYPKLFAVFEEYANWLLRLGIRGVGSLNDAIVDGRLPEISLVGEALHSGRIAQIASEIAGARDRIKVVLVAGPSSSGKTTFSKRLAVQLIAYGIRPYPLGLDDYFLDRDRTPRDEHGEYDYESLRALDVPLFNEHLLRMMRGEEVQLPRYDFKSGTRQAGPTITLDGGILIIEGIHGLNPDLIPGLPPERVYRVYVSALTQLNLDRHNRVSTTDCRLVRRIVRDAASRGYDATSTLHRWNSVVAGEKKHIFPFQENSDAVFNSALVHELAVLRPLVEPLLLQVLPDSPQWLEANRLLSFVKWFTPAAPDTDPTNSILREFIGGSVLETFRFQSRGSFGRG